MRLGHALEEPDVGDRHRQLDVPHALAPHARQGDLHAAAVADHALVLDALVLAAGAFPVLGRTENALAEQTALLRLEGPVVDGLGILDFALGLQDRMVSGEAMVMDVVHLNFPCRGPQQLPFGRFFVPQLVSPVRPSRGPGSAKSSGFVGFATGC
jgi:hypothetical protein